jgi:ATP synthase F0 subunit b
LSIPVQFADSTSSSNGIGAFNINFKAFIFQLITFLIVLWIFKRWILPPILKTLEQRRMTLEESLEQAKENQEALARAETRADEIIAKARASADEALAEAKKSAAEVIAKGETAAAMRAALIIKDAESRLSTEREKLRQELRAELAGLVADATEKIISEKLDKSRDMRLIDQAIKELT